jgi:hypothetical protein
MARADFGNVLEALKRAAADGGHPHRRAGRARYQRAFVVAIDGMHAADATATATAIQRLIETVYGNDAGLGAAETDLLISMHTWVADTLQLRNGMTAADLTALRRRFALAYHPDRAAASEREQAGRRMMIANMLIDQALARLAS